MTSINSRAKQRTATVKIPSPAFRLPSIPIAETGFVEVSIVMPCLNEEASVGI